MTGKSIVMSGPSQLRFGNPMAQGVIESLHATNVVEAREMITSWRGNSSAISAGIICDIDGTGIKASRLALSGKMGVGPRISMKTLWGIEDVQLRLQLTFTKDASIFIFPSEGDSRNLSNWIDGNINFKPEAVKGNAIVPWEDIQAKYPDVDFEVSVRAIILLGKKLGEVSLGIQALPKAASKIDDEVDAGTPLNSWACPAMSINIGRNTAGNSTKLTDINFSMTELESDGYGIGNPYYSSRSILEDT